MSRGSRICRSIPRQAHGWRPSDGRREQLSSRAPLPTGSGTQLEARPTAPEDRSQHYDARRRRGRDGARLPVPETIDSATPLVTGTVRVVAAVAVEPSPEVPTGSSRKRSSGAQLLAPAVAGSPAVCLAWNAATDPRSPRHG